MSKNLEQLRQDLAGEDLDKANQAFTYLYKEYAKQTLAKISSYFSSSADIGVKDLEDLLHDQFLALWTNRRDKPIHKGFEASMFKRVKHRAIDQFRKIARRRPIPLDSTDAQKFFLDMEMQMLFHVAGKSMEEIDQMIRPVLSKGEHLVYEQLRLGLAPGEIADELALRAAQVSDRLYRIRAKAKEQRKTNYNDSAPSVSQQPES